ncbi:MAG: mannosylglucosylglycerate synthase [Sphaerochaeta sp.]|jgi:glycosyltransferase involved in cell wall biosynthesis|nr:mannosylglucosylglycerate synthase [Sphaerochaeta sp.]
MIKNRHASLSIGMIHFKTGDTDGVSLEMDKWRDVFLSEGHTVHYCCGQPPMQDNQCTVLPSLSYFREEARALNRGTFDNLEDFGSESAYEKTMENEVLTLTKELLSWIDSITLDVLIVENIWSVGLHPAAAIALENVIHERRLHVLAHHHDFYWERVTPIRLTCNSAMRIADQYLPPHGGQYAHVVINSKAQKALAERKGINSNIIPNVFDFSKGPWEIDTYNSDFREAFGINEHDVLLLQATRVVKRKGIELAIDFAQILTKKLEAYNGKALYNGKIFSEASKVVLVLAGSIENDAGAYLAQLKERARSQHVNLLWIGEHIEHTRTKKEEAKIYSLWDAYAHADMVTYPSYWEGWGNQLLEAVVAKLPIVLFPYEIYNSDIKKSGFSMIELGDRESLSWDTQGLAQLPSVQIEQAAIAACTVLFDRHARLDMVESNFKIGQESFSLETLSTLLKPYVTTWSNTLW